MICKVPRFFLIVLPLSLAGCLGAADYSSPPPGATEYGSGPRPVYPDTFKVSSDSYPRFRAREDFLPPRPEYCYLDSCTHLPITSINRSDQWKVKYVFKGLYIIQSDEYNKRQCFYLEQRGSSYAGSMLGYCAMNIDFDIYITTDGVVSGGWELLAGGFAGPEARTYFNPSPKKNEGWPVGKLFLSNQ